MPHTWKRALDEYRYPVDLRKFSGAPECNGWFELNICPGDPRRTMGFECRFREQARHHREAWGELVFWKLFTIPPARNQRAQRVLDLEVRPAELWSSCMNYIDKSGLASFRAFKRVLRVQGSGVALAATFPAFLCPDRFPMVDTQVTKWALDNHAKHTYSASLCLPGRSEKIREVVCRFGAHVPIRAVWLARAADLAVRRRPGARVIRRTSASSNRTARSAGCVVNWRAPPATGTDGSVAANASRSNSTRRGGPAADRQPPLPRTGRKVAAGVPGGGLAHATVGRAAGRARNRSTRPSRRRRRRRVRTAAARLK